MLTNSTVAGIDIANGDINQIVYDSNGNVASSSWQTTPGTYTMIISYDGSLSGYDAGGQAVVTFTVYKEAVNADAIAAVLYDVDGDGTKEVVSSVEAAYDGTDLAGRIETVVETANGYRLMPVRDYTVRYYSADGTQVRTLIDAGTYTLKVTSDIYKLTGTTEMTVTINKIGATNVKAAAVTDKKWEQRRQRHLVPALAGRRRDPRRAQPPVQGRRQLGAVPHGRDQGHHTRLRGQRGQEDRGGGRLHHPLRGPQPQRRQLRRARRHHDHLHQGRHRG